jgi:YVTN family beta-propeller protein
MRRIMLLATLGLATLATTGAAALPDVSGTVWVTERTVGTVTAFEAATGNPLGSVKVGASPIGITLPRGTHKVYSSDEGSNRMSVIDAETLTVVKTIPMGPLPHHLMASRNGKLVFVGEFGSNQIGVVDTQLDERTAGYTASPLANARTHAVFVTRNGRDLYATNTRAVRTEIGDIAKLDARTGELFWNFTIGVDPSEILVTPDGHTAYVSVRGENKIKVVDVSGHEPALVGEAVIGTMPDTLQLTPDGKTLVVTLRGTPAQVSFMDTETLGVQIVDVPGHTVTGHHWLSANGTYSFVAVESPAGLAVVDNHSRAVVADYLYPNPPGGTRAHGVFFEPSVRH